MIKSILFNALARSSIFIDIGDIATSFLFKYKKVESVLTKFKTEVRLLSRIYGFMQILTIP